MNGSKKLCFVALGAIKEAPEATPDPFRTVSLEKLSEKSVRRHPNHRLVAKQ
jgi:hypothetical protein